jgi:LDH2 family malate/lactate/ureidoglycolate dehydrogenase
MKRVPVDALTDFGKALLAARGAPEDVATAVARSLVYADMRGVASHGVVRLPIYLERLERGMVNAVAEPAPERDDGATVLLDGRNNFGAHVGRRAMGLAVERARAHGIALVGVKRSNHFGTAAFFVDAALAAGQVALVLSNASQTMPPVGGRRPFLGTNPLCIACPTPREAPFVLDMATSVVARGKIIFAARAEEPIPEGWAVDAEGRPTTDAAAGLEGSVLPVGGAKGFGLAMAIDILSGVLTGAGFGPTVNNMYENWQDPQDVGHAFLSIDITRFMPLETFSSRIDAYIDALKAAPRAPGVDELLYAGELEHRHAEAARAKGVALPSALVDDLDTIAMRLRIPHRLGAAGARAAE